MQKKLEYDIVCYQRELVVLVDEDQYEEIYSLLDKAYVDWNNAEDIKDKAGRQKAYYSCLEEYMLEAVESAGFQFLVQN